jgi:hypothetical protein
MIEVGELKFKTAKCERSGEQILLSDGWIVCNAPTGEWSFVSIDANENTFDYHVELTALVKSPEALVDWLAHIGEKTWFKPEKFFEFFKKFRKENNLYGCL